MAFATCIVNLGWRESGLSTWICEGGCVRMSSPRQGVKLFLATVSEGRKRALMSVVHRIRCSHRICSSLKMCVCDGGRSRACGKAVGWGSSRTGTSNLQATGPIQPVKKLDLTHGISGIGSLLQSQRQKRQPQGPRSAVFNLFFLMQQQRQYPQGPSILLFSICSLHSIC